MKKNILLISVLGFMLACSGKANQNTETPDVSQEQIETIEQSTQKLDEAMRSSEKEIDTLQNEIDNLLNEI